MILANPVCCHPSKGQRSECNFDWLKRREFITLLGGCVAGRRRACAAGPRRLGTRVADLAYLAPASGSIPLFLIASAARGEARNAINRLALSTSPEPATMAAENTCGNWISGARLPA